VLTIKGDTRDVVLDVKVLGQAKDPWGNERAAFSGTTSIDRREFRSHLEPDARSGWRDGRDRIDIAIDIEAVRQVAAQVA
jgi:polyisoprenoid-binding protein YceI